MRVLNHPKKVVITVLVSSVIMVYFCSGLKTNNAIEVWLNPDTSQLATYHNFLETFGSEEFILVVMENDKIFVPEDLALGKRLSQQLEKIPGISKVSSIADFYQPGLTDFATFKQMVLSEPVFRKTWVSRDGKVWASFIQLDPHRQNNRASLVAQVRAALKKIIPQGERYHLAGPPVFNVTLDNYSRRAALIFSPLIFLLAGLVLWAIYRSFSWAALSLMVAGIVILWSLAGLALFEHDLNMVTSALPPLLLVISLSYILHFFNAYQQEGSIKAAISRVNKPIFFSSLTTSLGFGSLVVSDIGPIRDFGLTAGGGILLAYLLVMSFLPASLSLIRPSPSSPGKNLQQGTGGRLLQWIGDINVKGCWVIISISLMCLLGSIIYIRQLKIEVNALHFLKQNHPMVQDYLFIEKHLMGLSPLELVVELPQANILDHNSLTPIMDLQQFLEQQPEIVNTLSLLDWLGLKERLFNPFSFLGLFPEMSQEGLEDEIDRYYIPTSGAWRISCRVKTLGSSQYRGLIRRIEKYTQHQLDTIPRATITGLVPLLINMQDTLLRSQLKSFLVAGSVIGLAMLFLTRSLKFFLVAMIPNLWPIVLIFGFMGLAQIPLDVATVMVASIAVGIAADNTIHFIFHSRKEIDKGNNHVIAMFNTLHGIGRAMIFTSLVTASGFSVLCLSQFNPMIYFGLLSTITIFAALLADLFLHPVLLLLFGQKYKERGKR